MTRPGPGTPLTTTHRPFCVRMHPKGCVWLESAHEYRLYDWLCAEGMVVEKPLHLSTQWHGLRPDFVLQGYGVPIVVEVWGMDTAEYRDRMLVKRAIFREEERAGRIRFAEWDVIREREPGYVRLQQTLHAWTTAR